ncbi:MAG TPA: hemopexin repeat-containing protein [Polyangiaceae bacterium]|nr:hemopexin repeat-containing protein [Polyangiaceae bacterium]
MTIEGPKATETLSTLGFDEAAPPASARPLTTTTPAAAITTAGAALPSFTDLFGPMDKAEGLEARSVLSPAAYLVDLLQLKDSASPGANDYHERRPDVGEIPLDGKSTFGELPHLELANGVMAAKVVSSVTPPETPAEALHRKLSARIFPSPLPFVEAHERLKRYLERLGVDAGEIYRAYREQVDGHEAARLRLGLSAEEFDLFSTAHDGEAQLEKLWGVDPDPDGPPPPPAPIDWSNLEFVKQRLGLSLKELKRLVAQDLSDDEVRKEVGNAAETFFINQGKNYLVIDEATKKIRLNGGGAPPTPQHLDRMMRFVRLARRLQLDFVDLDWLLQSTRAKPLDPQDPSSLEIALDADALQSVAIALGIGADYELPVDEVCALWVAPKGHGRGDGQAPNDLFDRLFNNGFDRPLDAFVLAIAKLPETALGKLDDRLQASAGLSGADYTFLKAALAARGLPPPAKPPALVYGDVARYFSVFYRFAALARALSLGVRELVTLVDLLDAQRKTAAHFDLAVPVPFPGAALPPAPPPDRPVLGALLAPSSPPRSALGPLQKLLRVEAWLDRRGLSVRQLAFLCVEDDPASRERLDDGTPIDEVATDDEIEAALADLSQSLGDTMLTPPAMQTGSLTPEGARLVFDALRRARVLATFDDDGRALLRVQPSEAELAAAMQRGIEERLEVQPGDFRALGIADPAPLFSLLVDHGYLDKVEEARGDSIETRYSIAAGLDGFFATPANAAKFTMPNFQEHGEAVFAAIAQKVDAPSLAVADFEGVEVDASNVPALFEVLRGLGHLEPVEGSSQPRYRVAASARDFFLDPANAPKLALPNFAAAFAPLAARAEAFRRARENRPAEAKEVADRLSALAELQAGTWQRNLAGLLGVPTDLAELAFAFSFGTPDESATQTFATLALPLFEAKRVSPSAPALSDAYLRSRFLRLRQLALLLRKAGLSADEARVFLKNQQAHRRLPEALKPPEGFFGPEAKVDALARLPGGDFLLVSGQRYATFSRSDYRLLESGPLADLLQAYGFPEPFRARALADGVDCAFNDRDADDESDGLVLHVCAGDQYVTVSGDQAGPAKPVTDFGRVRNNVQENAHIDAAVEDDKGRLFLFSGDQYYRYTDPTRLLAGEAVVDETYPRSIRTWFEGEGLTPLPSLMRAGVDAAFRDADGSYYFFSGNHFAHSSDPYQIAKIRPSWGLVLNHVFDDDRVDAAFVFGDGTYLVRRDQVIRYTGGADGFVDESYPVSFGNLPEADARLRVLRRFPGGVRATLAGADGALYAFEGGLFAGSAEPDLKRPIREHWGLVRNHFVEAQRVDAAFYHEGVTYLFSGDQYIRYSGPDYTYVDESYPWRVRPNWNQREGVGLLPDALPEPVSAVAVGSSGDVYFFGGNQFAGPDGALGEVKDHWARVRNNIEALGRVDGAMLGGDGRLFLFSGDQFYRYTSPGQEHVDEGYPLRLAGHWALEGPGFALPAAFEAGLTEALRAPDGKLFFFSGQHYARVDAPGPTRPVAQDWALVRNWIATNSRVEAAFVDPQGTTYLFGGDQFVRYSSAPYESVDEGYPLATSNRWGNLPDEFRAGIDAALSFTVNGAQRLYLFRGRKYVRYTGGNYTQIDAGYPKDIEHGDDVEGAWFRGFAVNNPNGNAPPHDVLIVVEAIYVDTFQSKPRICLFYNYPGAQQWKREYRADGPGGSYRWSSPQKVEGLTEYLPFTRIETAFVAPDGTLHLFSGDKCASRPPQGGPLTTPVPTRERFARVFNQFTDLGRVDAALSLPDGRTYLFCAKQFTRYSGALRPGEADFYADEGYPKTVATTWGAEGLPAALPPEFGPEGHALFRDAAGAIHLFKGQTYVRTGGPAAGEPVAARWGRVDNRFRQLGRVDAAYRAENGKLYLFCGDQFTRYGGDLRPGAPDFYGDEGYPRRIATRWPGEGLDLTLPPTFEALGYAILRDTTDTYVFAGPSFTSRASPEPRPLVEHWAKVRNELQAHNRVDAGFVLGQGPNAVTLVFSGDQYVRYSGPYDGVVDEGYPLRITRLAEVEGAFAPPEPFLGGVRGAFQGLDGDLHFFTSPPPEPPDAPPAPQLYVSSAAPDALTPPKAKWGIVDNELFDRSFVNAALLSPEGKLYLFSGDQYVKYSGADRTHIDEGYPKKITSGYADEIGAPGLAPALDDGVGAALVIGDVGFYFAGDRYVDTREPGASRPLVDRWGLVENRLQATRTIDAGLLAPSGNLYLFCEGQYVIYSGPGREYVDETYPKTIATDLGQRWPAGDGDFRVDLDAAASFEGRSYLFKGSKHVRLSGFRLEQPDAGYPLAIAEKFEGRHDFELGTLPDVWDYRQLVDDVSAQTSTVVEYLDGPLASPGGGAPAAPEAELALVTQWPTDEIEGLLPLLSIDPAALRDSRTVAHLARTFRLAERLGTTPLKLESQLWQPAFGPSRDNPVAAADFAYALAKAATDAREWPAASAALAEPLNAAKRDALVAYLVHVLAPLGLKNADDLYEYLLTDVQMSPSASTSKIVEAINSVQLYYHRTLVNLEDRSPQDFVTDLKSWWHWMKNYRIWEANRKVFLYPENYIRPELRTEKSPAFIELEQKLLQDEITPAAVEEAYHRYLESFNDISRLRVVGGYKYKSVNEDGREVEALFMLGRTRTSPPVYYYRFGELDEFDRVDWAPWQKVGVTINALRVELVRAFNKLFLFWVEAEPFNATEFQTSGDKKYGPESPSVKQVKLTVKFSYYNFNHEWVPPQTLRLNPDDPSDPEPMSTPLPAALLDLVRLQVSPVPSGGDATDYISLKFHFLFWSRPLGRLSAALDLEGGGGWSFGGLSLNDQRFQFPTETGLDPEQLGAIVYWGSDVENDAEPWLCFEAKGGSFLLRPTDTDPVVPGQILGRAFPTVSAAFTADGGDLFVFAPHNAAGEAKLTYHRYVAAEETWADPVSVDEPAWPWGRPTGVLAAFSDERVRNALVAADGRTYFVLDGRHFTYPASGYAAIEQHYADEAPEGPPPFAALVGDGTPGRSWQDATADGSVLVRAFKYENDLGPLAIVLTAAADGSLGFTPLTLDQLRQFTLAEDGTSPVDGWDGIDAVFHVEQPAPSVVVCNRRQLLILSWSSKAWSNGTLGELPGSGRLSAAFTGVDHGLYLICDGSYAVANPLELAQNQLFSPLGERWGRPSLFSWLLSSVDGAVMGPAPGRTLYLFSKEHCVSYPGFNPAALGGLVFDESTLVPNPDAEGRREPPKTPAVWGGTFDDEPAVATVTAALGRNGVAFLFGANEDNRAFATLYSRLAGPPFSPALGTPMPLPGNWEPPPTDFYARMLSPGRRFKITRLTSQTTEQFGRRLFAGGVRKLLSLETQQLEEWPRFVGASGGGQGAGPNEIAVNTASVDDYPGKGDPPGLDFESSNGFYYREIFFHIPFLIAQALKRAQRFEDAKAWYEYVFDPTKKEDDTLFWRFAPFLEPPAVPAPDGPLARQIDAYRDDPFDPHQLAEMRPIAYRKAFVMSYIDNLLEWGDMLFRRYTRESIGEATMLYVLAADLLGKKPEEVGKRRLDPPYALSYDEIRDRRTTELTDEILKLENGVPPAPPGTPIATPNDSIFNPYFYIPENEQFIDYWGRLGDRLFKIRHGLNIEGVKQALALFAPPVDVMALVQAFAAGGGVAPALSDYDTPVPHYRFAFLLAKARELAGRVSQLGGALLSALEKKDAEALTLLRNTQEHDILELTLEIKRQQLDGARQSLAALQEGLKNAETRRSHYQKLVDEGLSSYEKDQVELMGVAQVFAQVSNALGLVSSVTYPVPQVGSPFAITFGGLQIGNSMSALSQAFRAVSEGFNFGSSLAATLGGWDRRRQDWELQLALASGDVAQVGRQIKGAEIQVEIARQEVQVQRRQIKHNESVETFMRSKFTSQQLYQWMVDRLSSVYFQTYQLALDYAKSAQRALQFELGLPEGDARLVGVHYWDSLRKGLLAGEQLQLDLDRLEKVSCDRNRRRLEITKHVSLLQLDPLALLKLKEKGSCEFELAEELFDADFPGHYCRQIKTVSVSLPAVVGPYDSVNATLTQLGHRTLLAPDKKALTYLLKGPSGGTGNGQGVEAPPASVLRVDWRPNQQVALSRGVNDSGLFQLNYQDERYLPFEGTGAVSTFRLEINGVDGRARREALGDVIVTLQYTALPGGDAFAETVKGAIGGKARARACLLNLAYDFPAEWQAFLNDPSKGMRFAVERLRLPGASEKKVTGVYLRYELAEHPLDDVSRQPIALNGVTLKPNSAKSGLNLPLVEKGQDPTQDKLRWHLAPLGAGNAKKLTRDNLKNIALVVTYAAKPSF